MPRRKSGNPHNPLFTNDDFKRVYNSLRPTEQIAIDDLLFEAHKAFPNLNRHERRELLFKLALYLALWCPGWERCVTEQLNQK